MNIIITVDLWIFTKPTWYTDHQVWVQIPVSHQYEDDLPAHEEQQQYWPHVIFEDIAEIAQEVDWEQEIRNH